MTRNSPPFSAERRDREVREQWAEREADVAARREERHPAGAPGSARVAGDLHPLGVKRADPETRDADEHEQQHVVRRDRREPDRDARDGDADRHQPDRPTPVRPVAEDRLRDRRRHRRDEHHGRRHRVREVQHRLEEDENRRQRTLREIRGEMTEREVGHGSPIDPARHLESILNPSQPGSYPKD